MSSTTTTSSSNAVSVLLGTLAAFVTFTILAALIQGFAGGKPADPQSPVRLQKKADVATEQAALLEKYGLTTNAAPIFAKAAEQIKTPKMTTTTVVVPGSATALKAAATPPPAAPPAAPAPAPASAPK